MQHPRAPRHRRYGVAGFVLLAPLQACSPFGDANVRTTDLPRATLRTGDDLDVSYVRGGDEASRRIVYVHGTPGDAGAFADYVRYPIDGAEAISIDRPGFGQTGGPALCSFERQAAAIEPLLVQRDGRWPVLVGHSLGGPIVARAAADYPDRVAAIVIIAGSLDPELEDPRWFNYAGAMVRPLLPRSLRNSNAEIFDAREQTELLAGVLDRVRCPVVIVHGTKDGLVPYANVAYMQRAFTNAAAVETMTIEKGDHFILWTQPAVVRSAIERAIELAGD